MNLQLSPLDLQVSEREIIDAIGSEEYDVKAVEQIIQLANRLLELSQELLSRRQSLMNLVMKPQENEKTHAIVYPYYSDVEYNFGHTTAFLSNQSKSLTSSLLLLQEGSTVWSKPLKKPEPISKVNPKWLPKQGRYKCSECDYTARQYNQMERHWKTHSGERPYSCSECSYSAALKHNLVQHIWSRHAPVKKYKCDECSYSATRRDYLAAHKTQHTGYKPYNCKECGWKTGLKSNMTQHMKRKH